MSEESLSQRLSREEIALASALDKVAMMADKEPKLFWFRIVFAEWMRPQSVWRRDAMLAVFSAAIDAINAIEGAEDYSI